MAIKAHLDQPASQRGAPRRVDDLARHDCVVILTNHSSFDYSAVVASAPLIVDSRNALGAAVGDHVFRLGAPSHPAPEPAVEAAA